MPRAQHTGCPPDGHASLGDMLAKNADLQPKPAPRSAPPAAATAAPPGATTSSSGASTASPWPRTDARASRRSKREYQQRAAAGPDFTGYHAKSDFSEPHVHDLDKRRQASDPDGLRPGPRVVVAERPEAARPGREPRLPRGAFSVLLSFAVKYRQAYPCARHDRQAGVLQRAHGCRTPCSGCGCGASCPGSGGSSGCPPGSARSRGRPATPTA